MTIISGATLRELRPVTPFIEARRLNGMSGGVSHAGYDIHVKQDVILRPGEFLLLSSVEWFNMPRNLVGIVHDKSTLARKAMSAQNTVLEPGWKGYLTLEVNNNIQPLQVPYSLLLEIAGQAKPAVRQQAVRRWERQRRRFNEGATIYLPAGSPIAQILFHRMDREVPGYDGKYQDQADRPVPAIMEQAA